MSTRAAAASEKWNPYACLLAVGRSQLFGVWFWSHNCSLLMEFPWLQGRHGLHGSEILIQPHECKLLSGCHTYWSSRVIITPGLSSSTPSIADIPLKTCQQKTVYVNPSFSSVWHRTSTTGINQTGPITAKSTVMWDFKPGLNVVSSALIPSGELEGQKHDNSLRRA